MMRIIARGAAAGAAGTTALNAVTYLDMAIRGRAASETPERSIEQVAQRLRIEIPGRGTTRQHRLTGIAALSGLTVGSALGVVLAGARAAGLRTSPVASSVIATVVAMVGANGPMVALAITDPREWSASDWAADIAPHVAYGIVTGWLLTRLDPG
jgi:hypothetical protein